MNRVSITPQSIKDSIDAVPPLQRHHVKDSYKKIPVEWDMHFRDVSSSLPTKNGDISLILAYGTDGDNLLPWPLVWVPANLNTYPELSRMEKGSFIHVKGIIREVDDLSIKLENCSLRFHKAESIVAPSVGNSGNSGTIIHHANQVHLGSGDNNIDSSTQIKDSKRDKKEWYERPLGVITLLVIAGLIVAYAVYWLHWAP